MAVPLLLVEDDDGIAAPLERALIREGYTVSRVGTGAAALEHIRRSPPAVVVLDLGLPDMEGLDICRTVRDEGLDVPIIILTARGDELDLVVGLDAGCDDYVAKPFSLAELTARLRSLVRRATPRVPIHPGALDGLRIDDAAHRVMVDGTEVSLSVKEYGVLALLARQPGVVVPRDRFIEEIWDERWYGSTKTLDVTVSRLRHKLAEVGAPVRVVAVRGVGFRIEPADA